MKAMMSVATGGPESLELTELEAPSPKSGDLLVRIRAAGVNFPDTLIIRDLYQMKPQRPFAPGGEIAGEVIAKGEKVKGFEIGDRILAPCMSGGYATHITINAMQAAKIPDTMPFDEAACFLLTYGTSYHALKDRAQLQPGEHLLVLGAAGGVGTAAIELGKAMGAKVTAAVSSEEKAQLCTDLGADATVIYPRDLTPEDQKALKAQFKTAGGGKGFDVVYDAVGGNYSEPAIRSLGWAGRFLVVGFPAGIPSVPLNLTLLKSIQIVGVFWGASVMQNPAGHVQNLSELFGLYKQGKIRPHISARFPLEDAGQALEALEQRKAQGKIVLTMD
ncbi:MAG: NADPH:quinone oxidoreductase family protein [Mangrovicoccus sp.]|nr:NADPH:quinone oxidoreductase family protein [Mangrovicoccus sp.]